MNKIFKFSNACQNGHIDVVNLMISDGICKWDLGMACACKGGQIDIINLMIAKGAKDWDWGMSCACETNRIDIVKLMLDKQPSKNNWHWGMSCALRSGHTDIVNLLLINRGNIPDHISDLTEEQIYLFYKSNIIPSNRFKSKFDQLKAADSELMINLKEFLLPDINNLVLSY